MSSSGFDWLALHVGQQFLTSLPLEITVKKRNIFHLIAKIEVLHGCHVASGRNNENIL